MPALPDTLAAPPPRPVRPADVPRGDDDTPSGTPFADLLEDAEPADGDAANNDDETKPPKGGAPASADAAFAALLPFLAPPPPQAPAATTAGLAVTAPPQGDGAAVPAEGAAALAALASAANADAATDAVAPKGNDAVPAATATPTAAADPQGDTAPVAVPSPDPVPAAPRADALSTAAVPVPAAPGVPAMPADEAVPKPANATPAAAAPAAGTPAAGTPDASAQASSSGAGHSGNNGAGNNHGGNNGGASAGGQRPSPALEVMSAAQAHADAVPPPTVGTAPAHAAAHYAAGSAASVPDGGAQPQRLPAGQLAQPLVRIVEAGGGEFRIDLAPDDLGPVRVVAELHGGRVALTIQAEHADTLSMLRRDIHHLERALNDAGFELDGGTLQFSLRGDDQPRGSASSRQDGGGRGMVWREEAAEPPPAERGAVLRDGLVDISV